jgi:peptide/nickel transport system substrate-binding protein
MKKLTIYLLLIVFLVALTGTFSLASSEKELVYVVDPAAKGVSMLDPIKIKWGTTAINLIYEGLVKMSVDGKYFPCLASSWEMSEDALTWTFKLKKGVKFHDGSEFNADIVKWFIKEMKEKSPHEQMVQSIKSVTVEDPYTVTFHMEYPDPNLLFNLSSTFMDIPSKEAIEKYGDDFGIKYAVGTGPFILDEWIMDDRMILKKNPDYKWGTELSENKGPAKIDKLVIREMKEEATVFMELKSGGVDIAEGVPAIFLEKIKEDKNIYVIQIPSARLIYLAMNTQKEPYTDIKVREAICLAINQEEIVEHVFMNVGKAAHTYLIDQLEESKVPEEYKIGYNLNKAKKIIAEAGWKDTDGDGILEKDGNKFIANLWVENISVYRRVAEVAQEQLRKLGIDAKITQYDSITFKDKLKKGEQELLIRLYGWDNADILEWYFNSKRMGYPNVAMWDDEKSDELMDKAMTEAATWEERVEYFIDYHKYLLKQFPWAPIYLPPVNFGIRKEVIIPPVISSTRLTGPPILDIDIE